MRIRHLLIAGAMLASLCLAGCGGNGSESATEGKVELETKAATSAVSETEAPTKAESKVEETAAHESESFTDKVKILCNGYAVGVGENYDDIKDNLGDEVKPEKKTQPCVPGAKELTTHFYSGVSIQTNYKGVILSLNISDENEEAASTPDGITLGSSMDDVKAVFGESEDESDISLMYTEGDVTIDFIFNEDGAMSISVNDSSIEM